MAAQKGVSGKKKRDTCLAWNPSGDRDAIEGGGKKKGLSGGFWAGGKHSCRGGSLHRFYASTGERGGGKLRGESTWGLSLVLLRDGSTGRSSIHIKATNNNGSES